MYDRVLAAAGALPVGGRFYEDLEERATLVKTFAPGPGERGPVLHLYKLSPAR